MCSSDLPELDRLNMGDAQILETTLVLRGRFPHRETHVQIQNDLSDHVVKNGERCARESGMNTGIEIGQPSLKSTAS